jgi:hypothetical protein
LAREVLTAVIETTVDVDVVAEEAGEVADLAVVDEEVLARNTNPQLLASKIHLEAGNCRSEWIQGGNDTKNLLLPVPEIGLT